MTLILCAKGGEIMATIQLVMLAELPYTILRDDMLAHPTLVEEFNMLFAGAGI